MRIKRISLQGYKTFATKTDFLFDDGITAIVGPNGSGKSNIADALRWVLGEQSYSTLRGKRTTDMIFAGSRSRPRAGMAQSILTLDNSDGWLPIDYTEVEIGRRAFRSGENEYILNGQKVRLKDITDLLATSGLAQRTYTIIGQGLVDRALSLRSEERRALFEEAAGINHYKARRHETLRRLQDTQRNLQRIHDILAEIRPRLNSLRRQATRARNYEQVSVDLTHLLRIWYGFKWEQAKKELRDTRDKADSAETLWQKNRQTLRVRQINADDIRKRIHRLEAQNADIQSQREQLREQYEVSRREVAILQERQKSLVKQLADIDTELPNLVTHRDIAQRDLQTAVTDLELAQAGFNEQNQQLRQFNASFQSKQAEINRWQATLAKAQQARRRFQSQVSQRQGQLGQLKERLDEQKAPANSDEDGQIVQLAQETTRLSAVLKSREAEMSDARQARETCLAEQRRLTAELKRARSAQREEERQLNQQTSQLARLEARVDMLDQLRLKEISAPADISILGNLAGLIEIPDSYRIALEAALGTRLGALILSQDRDLQQLLSRQTDDTSLIALALDALNPPQLGAAPDKKGVIGWASDLISGKAGEHVNRLLLGSILIVEDRATALAVRSGLPWGSTAVSLDGFQAHAGGVVEMGSGGSEQILAREDEWRQGIEALEKHRTSLQTLTATVEAAREQVDTHQAEVDRLREEEQQLSRRLNDQRQQSTAVQRDLDRQRQQQAYLERQRQRQQEEVVKLEQRIGQVELLIEGDSTDLTNASTALNEAQVQLDALPVTEAQEQRNTIRRAIEAAETIVAGRQAVVDSRRATLNQAENQLARLQARQSQLLQEQAQLALTDLEQDQQRLQAELAAVDSQLKPSRERLLSSRAELAESEESAAVAQKETHDSETVYTQTKIAYTQRTSEIENLQDRIKTDLGIVSLHYDVDQTGPTPLPISGVQELPEVEELPDDIEETIQQYRAQMQRMGAINPDAPEEFEETEERFEFLTQQVEDLNQTEAQLREVIAELDELTSRAFAETVDKVNKVFEGTFTQLFGGGSGRLILTDPDDLTISGVDIIARLPNRREQALGLLSGGERSLTAVALIFSLLKVSPTPFCVMDEVDAALDEANINRFRELLRELSLETQFIVITHNRGTVQAAQTIYGISMGTDSASQAISIKPEDYVKQPELI